MSRARRHGADRGSYPAGFAMVEVRVTLVVLLIGLLGLVGLMVRADTAQMESYQRVQAVILLNDMVNRIDSNRAVADCYANAAKVATPLGAGYAGTPSCALGSPAQNAQAVEDLKEWNTALLGSAEVVSGTNVGAMIGARGCVELIDAANKVYMVSVNWQGLAPTAAPADACGQGQYGDDRTRRQVTATLRIGTLL